MATLPRDPLTGTDRLLIDGTNLLHAMSRKAGAAPQAALIGRLRAIVPASVGIELIFDGAPDSGMRGERIASGLIVRHAGRRSADDVLLVARRGDTSGRPDPRRRRGCSSSVTTTPCGPRCGRRAPGRPDRPGCSGGWSGRSCRRRRSAIDARRRGGAGTAQATPTPRTATAVAGSPGRGATTKKGNPRRGRPPSGSMPT